MIIYLILQQLQNIFSGHHNPCFHLWRIVDVIDDFPYFASQSSKVGQSENGIFLFKDVTFCRSNSSINPS